ncbi:hypothetical protein ACFFRC_46025 [Amycolatopsis halotolerans]
MSDNATPPGLSDPDDRKLRRKAPRGNALTVTVGEVSSLRQKP